MKADKRTTRPGVAVGVDGCPGGWLAVTEVKPQRLVAWIAPTFSELIKMSPMTAVIGVDIPIGLPETGARQCELEARQLLGWPRRNSVFSAPLRPCLTATTYRQACRIRFQIEGKEVSQQAFGILPKIREVDEVLRASRTLAARVVEVHPEVSFALMNRGLAMTFGKKRPNGKAERRALLDRQWPGCIEGMRASLRGEDYTLDDLHDAMAAHWSVRRWVSEEALELGDPAARDRKGLPMRIVA